MRPIIWILITSSAFAVTLSAQNQQTAYEKAVLDKFSLVSNGTDCSSSATSSGDQQNVSVETDCSSSRTRQYTVHTATQRFVLESATSGKALAAKSALVIGTLGYGALFLRHRDVLKGEMPGTQIFFRTSGAQLIVKVGDKESLYSIVAAE